jgi:hypothetical protein
VMLINGVRRPLWAFEFGRRESQTPRGGVLVFVD